MPKYSGRIKGSIVNYGTDSGIYDLADVGERDAATYTVTPDTNSIDEGSTLGVTVTTTGVQDGTTLYWTIVGASDFGTATGNFVITGNVGSFNVTPTADSTTEGPETFQIQIRTESINGTIVETTGNITINDTSLTPVPTGQVAFTSPGSYYWTVPDNVTSVSAVAIGGGGGGSASTLASNGVSGGGGGGGGLGWATFSATPGDTWNIIVGAGGAGGAGAGSNNATAGGQSYINIGGSLVVRGLGGAKGVYNDISGLASGGAYSGGGGGTGGQGGAGSNGNTGGGGGGAGGYSGAGGRGASGTTYSSGTAGSGGGGGGSTGANGFTTKVNWGGGGVGILGQGSSGGYTATGQNVAGQPGSGGTGQLFGGGGAGAEDDSAAGGAGGGSGAVRIIWGQNRAYPSTNTGDL